MSTPSSRAENPPNDQTTRRVIPAPGPTKASKTDLQEGVNVNTDVRSANEASKVLQAGQYLVPGTPITATVLSYILLQLSQSMPKPPKQLVNGIRAVAFLLDDMATDTAAEAIANAVMIKLKDSFKEIQDATVDMGSVTDNIKDAAAKNLVAIDSIREDLGELSEKVTQVNHELTDRSAQNTETPLTPALTQTNTFIPPQHAAAVTQSNTKSRQIYIRTAPGMEDNGLKNLSEKELVAKAQIALDLMGVSASDAPDGTAFVGARKLRTGVIQYQLNSESSAAWIQDNAVMASFMEQFGGTSIARSQLRYTVAEFVPVSFDPDAQTSREIVERNSGLPMGAMVHAKYIKAAHKRSAEQKVAHAIVGYSSREAANHAIEHGLYVDGKLVLTRKLLPEPKRCLKCQTMGTNHIAAQCKSIHDVCANCAGMHRTESCGLTDRRKFRCSNCNGTEGHGAADRQCPQFLIQLKKLHARIPDTKYKYFPTNDPKTWELIGQSDVYENDQDATWQQGANWQGGWTQVQHGKQRRGTGRLAGGQSGEGGGTRNGGQEGKQYGGEGGGRTKGGLWGRTETGNRKETGNTRFQASRVPDKGWQPSQKPISEYFPTTKTSDTWGDSPAAEEPPPMDRASTPNAAPFPPYTPLHYPDSPLPPVENA